MTSHKTTYGQRCRATKRPRTHPQAARPPHRCQPRPDTSHATTGDPLLMPAEAARQLRKSVRILQQWRWLGEGPAYVKVGRSVRYYQSDLDAWLKANRVQPRGAP